MNKLIYIVTIIMLSACYVGEELPPDQDVWEYAYPTQVGLSDLSLLDMDAVIKAGSYSQINGMIIIKDDQLAFENYYNFSGRNEIKSIGRITFTLLTLSLDLFVQDGYIHLDEPIMTYLPEYEELFAEDSLKQLITIRHLIGYRSGLVWSEAQSLNSDIFLMKNSSDWTQYVLAKEMEAPPGLRTVVNSGGGVVLAAILQNQLGDIPLREYLNEKLFSKMGISQMTWEETPNGNLNGASGLSLKALDLTRIGYLMLNEGRWTDKKRIIRRDWVLEITSEQTEVDFNYSFGYTWWIFTESFNNDWLNQPGSTTFFAAGESGQNLYILPEKNMVICITASNYNVDFYNHSLYLFMKSLESLQPALNN